MSRLLLLTNIIALFFIVSCCHSKKTAEQSNSNGTKQLIADSVVQSSSTKAKGLAEPSGLVGTGEGIRKDTINTTINGQAIIHHAPDQEKIDSIKAAKTKHKK
jgi:hypothetical protein